MLYSAKNRRGMTLLEMTIVVLIIAILSTLVVVTVANMRRQSRDSLRVSDISQLQIALSAYYRDLAVYPTAITANQEIRSTGSTTTTLYMDRVPAPPTPLDGDCAGYQLYNSYYYLPSLDYKSYCLFFCLGANTSELTAGAKIALPSGTIDAVAGDSGCSF